MKAGLRISLASLLLSFLLLGSTLGFAQGIVTGSISGIVTDQQKAVVPNAKITAIQEATNRQFSTETNGEGYFNLLALPLGSYTLKVAAPSFSELKISNVTVNVARDTSIGAVALRAGAVETVVVEDAAQLVETASAQASKSFITEQVVRLPNAGTGFDNLALYTPGVVRIGGDGGGGTANFSNTNGAAISANGQRARNNNFQIDGQANNDNSIGGPSIFLSNPDAVGEFQVVTNNFSAEYGRNSGSVVNYVTKSGTNAFHGSAYEFYTGNLTYSRANQEKNPVQGFCLPGHTTEFGAPCTKSTVPRYVENRPGGSFGGPIWKDHAWFFAAYQEDRQRTGVTPSTSSTVTPTPNGIAALAAAFPNSAGVQALQKIGPYALKTGNPHPVGTLSTTNVTANGITVPVETATVQRTIPSPFTDHQFITREDINFSPKDRFFARYVFQKSLFAVNSGAGAVAAGAWIDTPAKDQQIGLDYTRTWTDHFLNQLRFSYSRAQLGFEKGAFPNCVQGDINNCPTNIAFSDGVTLGFGLATNLPQGRLINNTQYQDNASWLLGKHTLKFGGEYGRQRSPNVFLPNINGSFTFSSLNALVTNTPTQLQLADGSKKFNFKEQDVSWYFQDDWRIKDNLTLNLGIRWEWDQQAINLLHDLTVKQQSSSTPFWNTSVSTDITTLPHIPEDYNNFGPNIGFAWTPRVFKGITGENKTVIRGGYRITYDPAFYNIFLNVATAAPVVNLGTITGVGLPSSGNFLGSDIRNADLALLPRGANPAVRNQTRVTNNFHNPYTQTYSFGIQREIGTKAVVESRYVGSHTVGEFQTINGNPLISGIPASLLPSGVAPCADKNAPGSGRLNCNFSLLRVRNNGAWGIYHGLENRLELRNIGGFSGGLNYTFSKALDNASEVFASARGGTNTVISQNPFDPNLRERGVSAFSFPNVFSAYWTYATPWFKSQQGIFGHLLGGWEINGLWRYQTGEPFSVVQSTANSACDTTYNNSFIGQDSCRPILNNPGAPLNSVGRLVTPSASTGLTGPIVVNQSNCVGSTLGGPNCPAIAINSVHWLLNNDLAVQTIGGGNPFIGVGRNTLRGDPRDNVDLSVYKNIKVNERITLKLQADTFNIFNHMYQGTPSANANSRNLIGNPTQGPGSFLNTAFNTSNRRFMQLGVRIAF